MMVFVEEGFQNSFRIARQWTMKIKEAIEHGPVINNSIPTNMEIESILIFLFHSIQGNNNGLKKIII